MVMSLREAIQRYHDLLTDELGSASYAQLEDQQRRRGLFFGGRPLSIVLRPRFMTPEQMRPSAPNSVCSTGKRSLYSTPLASAIPVPPLAWIRFLSRSAEACA